MNSLNFSQFLICFFSWEKGAKIDFSFEHSFELVQRININNYNSNNINRISKNCTASDDKSGCGNDLETSFFMTSNGFTFISVTKDEIELNHRDGFTGEIVHTINIPFQQ